MNLYVNMLEPCILNNKHIIKVNGDKLQIGDFIYDFTILPNGEMKTSTDHIISAKRIDGDLYVMCINYIDENTNQSELFPQWQTIERTDMLDDDLTIVSIDWYSDDERASDELLKTLEPKREELEQAEFDLKLIEKLAEWGIL